MPHTCEICGGIFRAPATLLRHQNRKTPCAPIIESDADTFACRYCGRSFASRQSMNRHTRKTCKIANSEEGMSILMEHTIAKQNEDLKNEVDDMRERVTTLTDLVTKLLGGTTVTNNAQVINNAPVTNNTNIVNIHPWSCEEKLYIPATMLTAAFTENKRLIEYCKFSDAEKTNPELAAPYVLEALVDLTKRAHADPAARNVYLNPKRADQVMVFDDVSWQVRPLVDAIRSIFDSVAGNLRRIIIKDAEWSTIPMAVQSSASWIPSMYGDEPDNYAAQAKLHMSAHLQNMIPPAD